MCTRKLLCSTGTMVSKYNGYNYIRAISEIEKLTAQNTVDGAELMMLEFYYDKYESLVKELQTSGVPVPIIHCEKEIGTNLSDAGKAFASNDKASADNLYKKNLELFKINCEVGRRVGASKMVLHLWGGINSDSHIEYNISKLDRLCEIASEFGLKLLIENVPCTTYDPLSNFHRLTNHLDRAALIFDTRFAMFHRQIRQTLCDKTLFHHIEHIHISDIMGEPRDFSALKNILHPGQGIIDFNEISDILDSENYTGTVTLESPVMNGYSINTALLEKSLFYIGRLLCNKS